MKGNLPTSLTTFFGYADTTHAHQTRNSKRYILRIPTVKTTRFGLNSIKVKCVKCWNLFDSNHPSINFTNITKNSIKGLIKKEFFST